MSEGRDEGPRRPATERADELLSRVGRTTGIFASLVGMRIARVAAFAREEVEDMWAEARSMRQRTLETETNGDVKATASEGTDVSRREAEDQEPEKSAEPGEEARAGTATAEAAPEVEERKPEPEPSAESDEEVEDIKATPTARRRAEELGVDLREVKGTGADGQITASDVKKAGSKA